MSDESFFAALEQEMKSLGKTDERRLGGGDLPTVFVDGKVYVDVEKMILHLQNSINTFTLVGLIGGLNQEGIRNFRDAISTVISGLTAINEHPDSRV